MQNKIVYAKVLPLKFYTILSAHMMQNASLFAEKLASGEKKEVQGPRVHLMLLIKQIENPCVSLFKKRCYIPIFVLKSWPWDGSKPSTGGGTKSI